MARPREEGKEDALNEEDVAQDLAALEASVQRAPADTQAWLLLAAAYERAGMNELQVATLEHVARLAPANADVRGCLASALMGIGRTQEAIPHFDEANRLDPTDPWRRFHVGLALAELGEHGAAIERYREALDLKPDLGLAWMGLAKSLAAESRPAEAIPVFEKLLAFWPNNAGLLVDLANAYASAGDEPRAAQAIELAFRIDPVLAAQVLRREKRAA